MHKTVTIHPILGLISISKTLPSLFFQFFFYSTANIVSIQFHFLSHLSGPFHSFSLSLLDACFLFGFVSPLSSYFLSFRQMPLSCFSDHSLTRLLSFFFFCSYSFSCMCVSIIYVCVLILHLLKNIKILHSWSRLL